MKKICVRGLLVLSSVVYLTISYLGGRKLGEFIGSHWYDVE